MAEIPEESKVAFNYLGRSGLKVSNICLGTMTFGESQLPGSMEEANAHALIDRYVQWGGNFLDTADIYSAGRSEKIVGSWLAKQERERFVVATKVRGATDRSNVNAIGLSRRHITDGITASLERLQTDYVDLYQTHQWDDATPLEETLRTLDDLVRCGKVRYLGASNLSGWQMQRIVATAEKLGLNRFVTLQQQYNLLKRESEPEAFQVCMMDGLGVLPWSPLKAGFLTGKIKRGVKPDPKEGRMGWAAETKRGMEIAPSWDSLDNPRCWDLLDTLNNIAKAKGKSVAQVSLRWLIQKPVVTSVIIGMTKMHQLDDNMGASNGWELSQEEMAELDRMSAPESFYPYEMINRMNVPRRNPFNPNGYM